MEEEEHFLSLDIVSFGSGQVMEKGFDLLPSCCSSSCPADSTVPAANHALNSWLSLISWTTAHSCNSTETDIDSGD